MNNYFNPITNYNFKSCKLRSYNYLSSDTNIKFIHYRRDDKNIILESSFICCPCLYYIKNNDTFCFSFDYKQVVCFATDNNIKLTKRDNFNFLRELWNGMPDYVKYTYSYEEIQAIENWQEINIKDTGEFNVKYFNLSLFSIPLKNGFHKYSKWLLDNQKLIKAMIALGWFTPTITAGTDTRAFTGLWRSIYFPKNFYLRAVKADGKNDYEKGKAEVIIANKVAKRLGFENNARTENIKVTLNGRWFGNTRLANPNNPDYIFKHIQHSYGNEHKFLNTILPYTDNDWWLFKQSTLIQKVLLPILLCPDLLDIELISSTKEYIISKTGYNFKEHYFKEIIIAKDIIMTWGKDNVEWLWKELNLDFKWEQIVNI